MDKIIAILAGLVLTYYLYKWIQNRDNQIKKTVPVDNYGVPIQPNLVEYRDAITEIQSLI